jgi:predicted TIM-barrel fold metal-dependent hydrolase
VTDTGNLESWVVDAYVHHHWRAEDEVTAFMPTAWREYLGEARSIAGRYGQISINTGYAYLHPVDDFLAESYPAGGRGVPGADIDLVREHLFRNSVGFPTTAILGFHTGMFAPTLANPYLALEVCRAANEWTRECWLDREERFAGLILAPNHLPDEAAAEIRRAGADARFAGVLMAGNGLGLPFGHPLYHPIYAAAAELDLPIVLHYGGDPPDQLGGGLPRTYAEYRVLAAQPVMAHLLTCIGQGVFVKYPTLRMLVAGVGTGWVPWMLWRFDANYKAMRREAPWLTSSPSEYLRAHCFFTTWPLDLLRHPLLDEDSTEPLHRLWRGIEGLKEMLVYASGYPYSDAEWPAEVSQRLPPGWQTDVMSSNARRLFRLRRSASEGEGQRVLRSHH